MTDEYRLSQQPLRDRPEITVVGCGGTGGFVAEGLCRLFGSGDGHLLLIDHDRVEDHNLGRQNFYPGDVGKFKSEALASRLSRQYGREVWYSVYPFAVETLSDAFPSQGFGNDRAGLVIGCVDNAAAREYMARSGGSWKWWIDAGNGEHSGQVLIGNVRQPEDLRGGFDSVERIVHRLPIPTLQEPSLLVPVTEPETPDLDCAEAVDANLQSPVINQHMAGLVLTFVSKLFAGTLSWMGVYTDLEAGSLNPVRADPKTVAKMVGVRETTLIAKKDRWPNDPAPFCPNCGRHHW